MTDLCKHGRRVHDLCGSCAYEIGQEALTEEEAREAQRGVPRIVRLPRGKHMIAGHQKVTTTVRDLIRVLEEMPPDAPVTTEGCDCTGDAAAVELMDDGSVEIRRSNYLPMENES